MLALIFQGRVVQIAEKDFPVTPLMQWVNFEEGVCEGDYYVNGVFKKTLKSEKEFLKDCRAEKIAELSQACSLKILEKYPMTKQMNIGNGINGYTDSDMATMREYINAILERKDLLKIQITKDLDQIEDIKNFEICFEDIN